MFARVATYHGAPGRVKEGTRAISEITPDLQKMPGFQQAYLFVDSKSGKAYTLSLWDTEEQNTQSASTASPLRDRISQAIGASGKPTYEMFEVAADIMHRMEGARFARVSEYHGSPDKIEDGVRTALDSEKTLKQNQGFHRAFLFADRKSGRCMTITLWDSEDAMNRSSSGATPIREDIARALGSSGSPTVELFEVAGEIPQQARKAA